MTANSTSASRVIGLGHRMRQDDGVGPYVADTLGTRGFDAVVHEGDGLGLIALWENRARVIVVDALSGPDPAGATTMFDGDLEGLDRAAFVHSTHRIGLVEAVGLARTLGRLPMRLVIHGITGRDFTHGESLSPAVRDAADALIGRLEQDIQT